MKMKIPLHSLSASFLAFVLTSSAWAEDVRLPAPILEWSFYVLLIFGACVGIGVFFVFKRQDRDSEPLTTIMKESNATVHSMPPETTVIDCVREMNTKQIGAMLITRGQHLVGIFTERDAVTKVIGGALDPATTPVSEVMTKDPICVSPSTSVDEAMAIVTNNRFRHLPVVDNDKVVGIVSSGDLTHWLVQDLSGDIKDLVSVAGRRQSA
jgi:CBS domain-containing protein